MLKISRKIEYALMALKFIECRPKGLVTAREICDALQTPFDTMAKVLQALNANGVVSSVKGVKGGYQLEKSLTEISYKQLVEIIEGEVLIIDCQSKGSCDLKCSCNITNPLQQLNALLIRYMGQITIHDLFNNKLGD